MSSAISIWRSGWTRLISRSAAGEILRSLSNSTASAQTPTSKSRLRRIAVASAPRRRDYGQYRIGLQTPHVRRNSLNSRAMASPQPRRSRRCRGRGTPDQRPPPRCGGTATSDPFHRRFADAPVSARSDRATKSMAVNDARRVLCGSRKPIESTQAVGAATPRSFRRIRASRWRRTETSSSPGAAGFRRIPPAAASTLNDI